MPATAPALTVVDGDSNAATIDITLPVKRRHRGKFVTEVQTFTAYARSEGGAMMRIVAGKTGQERYAGMQALLARRLLDDDGIPHEAMPRFASPDELTWPGQDDDPGDAGSELDSIPDDAALAKLRKPDLVAYCEHHHLDSEGTVPVLAKALAAKRDTAPGAEVDVTDGEIVDDDRAWYLVWPDDTLGMPGYEVVVGADGEHYGSWDSLNELEDHARSHGSSLRRFIAVMDSVLETTEPEDIDSMATQIIEGAAGRPTRRSRASRSSRPTRGRSGH